MEGIAKFTGEFSESGTWRDATGGSGVLLGRIAIRHEAGGLSFRGDDGHTMTALLAQGASQPLDLTGTGGGVTSAGKVFIGDESIILDYRADNGGREEHNLDVWTFGDGEIRRAGVIRQADRTIWFEATMTRTG